MIICPNLSNPEVAREFEELKQATSEQAAYHIWSLNNGNAIDRAPNGAPSKLFLALLEHYDGDRTKAIQAKAKTYGKSFLLWFGNWTEQRNTKPLVKFYGPTMGKTTAAKSNTRIVDFDDIVREDIKKLANKKGISVRLLKTQSPPEYIQLLKSAIEKWRSDDSNIGKTLVVSNAALAKEDIFDNRVSIPSRDEFIRRLVERSEEDRPKEELIKEAKQYYDDLMSKWYENPIIENNYVSDLEQDVSKAVDENGEPLVVWHGGRLTENNAMPNPTYEEEVYDMEGYPMPGREKNPGIWFSTDKEYTTNFSSELYPVFLNIRHPYRADDLSSSVATNVRDMEDTIISEEDLLAQGGKSDGLIGHDARTWGGATIEEMENDSRFGGPKPKVSEGIEFAIYNPNLAKSIDNEGPTPYEGTFSLENDNIFDNTSSDGLKSQLKKLGAELMKKCKG